MALSATNRYFATHQEYIEAARKGIQQHGHSLAYAYRAIHRTPQVWLEIEILEADLLVSNQSESEIF